MMKTIATIGNPNSGKTTLFNALTGSSQKVGNWPGVTVEKKEGFFTHKGEQIKVVDLPGIYALDAASIDEQVALSYILSGEMNLILNIVDATNLERNLYLTSQLSEMKIPMLVVLNMIDIAEKRNITIDIDKLSRILGCPVIGISAIKKDYAEKVKDAVLNAFDFQYSNTANITYSLDIEELLNAISSNFKTTAERLKVPERWVALRVLEKTAFVIDMVKANNELKEKDTLKDLFSPVSATVYPGGAEKPAMIIAESRYKFAKNTASDVTASHSEKETLSDKIDKIVLNRILGIPLFLVAMYLTFWLTLQIGGAFIDFFDIAFGAIFVDTMGEALASIGLPEWLVTLLASGIGTGIQTVSTFIPIVFVMFLCLAILEDSGYMARAAFVMDRFMRKIGLPGKSFVPMLVGFGCTVPAVMATRTLENPRDRIMTVFMAPFMSCGARLPVYALFGAAFFGDKAGLMVFSLYVTGGLVAIFTGLLMKKTIFKGEPSYFVMELPPYHMPRIISILRSAWLRLRAFIVRSGRVIIVCVALLGFLNSIGTDGTFGNEDAENSVLSIAGRSITPIIKPLGIEEENWPAAVSLFTGLFAKEAIVGTLNSLYSQIDDSAETNDDTEEEGEEEFSLKDSLIEAFSTIPENLSGVIDGLKDPLGIGIISDDLNETAENVEVDMNVYNGLKSRFDKGWIQVYAYLLFILLYVPCIAAVGAIAKEIGGRLTAVLAAYLTLLGWIVSTLFYQIGLGREPLWIAIPLIMLMLIILCLRFLGNSAFMLNAIGKK